MPNRERWLEITGFPAYRVSDHGRVAGPSGILAAPPSGHYPQVNLYIDGKAHHRFVHKLVAEHFIGPCPEGQLVRHRDHNKLDCGLWNLEYGTYAENSGDTSRDGLHHNQQKTHCVVGHEFTEANTIRRKDRPGTRECRECHLARKRR